MIYFYSSLISNLERFKKNNLLVFLLLKGGNEQWFVHHTKFQVRSDPHCCMIFRYSKVKYLAQYGNPCTPSRKFGYRVICQDPTHPRPTNFYRPLEGQPVDYKHYPNLIYHINTVQSWKNIIELIHGEVGIEKEYANELVRIGAVYVATPSSLWPMSRTSDHLASDSYSESSHSSSQAVRYTPYMGLDIEILAETYCRVYANPKRHFGGYYCNWQDRVLLDTGFNELFIVNKPPDLRLMASNDNIIECAMTYVEDYIEKRDGVGIRCIGFGLDASSSGLALTFASEEAGSFSSALLQSFSVKRIYRVLCRSPKPLQTGKVTHLYQSDMNGSPYLLDQYNGEIKPGWKTVHMNIISCTKVNIKEHHLSKLEYKSVSNVSSSPTENVLVNGDEYYECVVEQIKYKTRQIRLQFAALNAPIVGDTEYESVRGRFYSDFSNSDSQTAALGRKPHIIGLDCHEIIIFDSHEKLVTGEFSDYYNRPQMYPINLRQDSSKLTISKKLTKKGNLYYKSLIAPWWREN